MHDIHREEEIIVHGGLDMKISEIIWKKIYKFICALVLWSISEDFKS